MNRLRTCAASLALGLFCALLPAASSAAEATKDLAFVTVFAPEHAVGEVDGALTLQIASNGDISGTYRAEHGGFVAVTGGLDGDRIWLDFAQFPHNGPVQITGTYRNGTIAGSTYLRGDTYDFTAKPA